MEDKVDKQGKKKDVYNLGQMLTDNGLQFKGLNEDGTIKVFDPMAPENEREYDIDAMKGLKDQGLDPYNAEFEYNTPMDPIDSQLGFLDQVKLLASPKVGDKVKQLEEKYGKGNVVAGDDASIVIKDEKGIWSKAESGFLASMAKESPVIAGSIAGSIKGASSLAWAGPKGILAGSILGGAIGAVG